jgi:hypothetical protein
LSDEDPTPKCLEIRHRKVERARTLSTNLKVQGEVGALSKEIGCIPQSASWEQFQTPTTQIEKTVRTMFFPLFQLSTPNNFTLISSTPKHSPPLATGTRMVDST